MFKQYPDFSSLSKSTVEDELKHIRFLGLSNTKAKNIILLSQKIIKEKQGIVPADFTYLTSLPGVGRKTANVVLSEGFGVPRIAVDTHVLRVSNRLGFVSTENPFLVEETLMNMFDSKHWHDLHLRLVFFGRYLCKAKKPECFRCPFVDICTYENKSLNQ
jgi:endonuclease-3